MAIKDGHVIVLAVILLILMFYTLHVIYAFIPVEKKCEPSFQVINQCRCIPDQHLADLFHVKGYYFLNLSQINGQINDMPYTWK